MLINFQYILIIQRDYIRSLIPANKHCSLILNIIDIYIYILGHIYWYASWTTDEVILINANTVLYSYHTGLLMKYYGFPLYINYAT